MTRLFLCGLLAVLHGTSGVLISAEPPVIVTFGDSVTAERGGIEVYSRRLAMELSFTDGGDVRVINAGAGGDTTQMAKRRLQKDVIDRNPVVVVIMFGINDAAVDVWKKPPATAPRVALDQYRSNLTTMIRELKRRDIQVVLMTSNPIYWTPKTRSLYGKPPYDPDDIDGFNTVLRNYVAAVRVIAEREKTGLIDVFAAFEAHDASAEQKPGALMPDGMHPGDQGHRIMADLLTEHLTANDPRFSRREAAQ